MTDTSDASRKKRLDLSAHFIFWPLMTGGLALDLWSKASVFAWLGEEHPYGFSIIDGFLQFVTAVNNGAAFGIAAGQRYLLMTVSIVALIVILGIFVFSRGEHKLIHVALGLFAAGICGNLYDRVFNGGMVRDFIDVYYREHHWPAFNAADSMLCIAVGLMLISTFLTGRSDQKHAQQHK